MSKSEITAQDARELIVQAQKDIRQALERLTLQLPSGFVVTGCEVGAVPVSLVGGERQYMFTANITVQVWTD